MMNDDSFPAIRFRGTLRPTQRRAADEATEQLNRGERRLHIVAPPGSGKTILGLYLWAELAQCPALVLSPNATIQSQWIQRLDLFKADDHHEPLTSTDPLAPALLTSLTYQSVTLPQRRSDDLDAAVTPTS